MALANVAVRSITVMMGPLVRGCVVGCVLGLMLVSCAAEAPANDPVARGAQVYRARDCGSCHESGPFGLGRRAPALDHVGSVAATRKEGMSAADYLRESVVSPGAYVVPGFPDSMPRGLDRALPPADLDALVAYLLSRN